MPSPYAHLEVLGPRASLDRWLAVVQDHGGCHLADALEGLEAEAGIARPVPTADEGRADVQRSEIAHLLRGIERVLPGSAAGEDVASRPAWTVGAGAEGEPEFDRLLAEGRDVGRRLREALEAARTAERAVEAALLEERALAAGTVDRTSPEARAEVARRLADARGDRSKVQADLDRCVAADGARARLLLDALEDAEARTEARRLVAATAHVAALRLFVRPEDEARLRRHLDASFGDEVIVRTRAEADDVPAPPRAVAGVPLAALRGLAPRRFGAVALPALLALAVPLIVGVLLADLVAGLLLLVVGGLLGAGAPAGSPRRDTALLSQVAGLAALLVGMLTGRAAGEAGIRFFGEGWGLTGAKPPLTVLDTAPSVLAGLGLVALLLALWGGICAVRAALDRSPGRARDVVLGALHALVLAAVAIPALGVGGAAGSLWVVAPAAVLAVGLLAGLRFGWGRLLLDFVGVVRLFAVAVVALVAFEWSFGLLADPTLPHLLAAPAVLLVATLAVLVEPAHVAMGVPYDLSLGSGSLAHPFTAFGRTVVHRRVARGLRRASS